VTAVSLEVYLTPLALIYVGEHGEVGAVRFGQDGAKSLARLLAGEPTREVEEFSKIIQERGVREVRSPSEQLLSMLTRINPDVRGVRIKEGRELERLAVEAGLVRSIEEYRSMARLSAIRLVEEALRLAVKRRDLMIVHAVNYLDDVQKMLNMACSRLMEWFGTHFPELREFVSDPEKYAELVLRLRNRRSFDGNRLQEFLPPDVAAKVEEAASRSVGVDIAEQDEQMIWNLASMIHFMIRQRDEVEGYLRTLMSIEAPNLSSITGPILGARLISLAGGLENLAKLPASTIQVLGAEKALFRFFKTGRGAPKHGIIFQHPYVHGSPKWQRGKIARALATKISLAAKIDYFSGEDRSAELRAALEKRAREIKEKYQAPPPRRREARRKR
jgi:nucleolar protein 56